ncbi:endonuclease/exonuclease/phosphatase family protein [bacterium]|nr:endonuclease/exonuclease/phosphatase family protein [bacterium]
MDRQRETDSPGDRRQVRRIGRLAWAARAVLGLALVSLAARWMFADRWIITEWNFHIPLPLPMLVALGAAFFARPGKRQALGIAIALPILIVMLLWREQPALFPHREREVIRPVRLVAWNLMSYNRGEKKVTETLVGDDADIVCILEGTYRGQPPEFLQKALGDETQWASTRQMAIGTRFPILESEELETRTRLRVFRATIEIEGTPCTVYLIDMPVPPRFDTREMYNELWAILKLERKPLILVGDFNTPRGSWHLRRTTSELTDAYRAAAPFGWLASWPSEFPIYQLDHAFFSPELRPCFSRFGDAHASDHCRQIIEFEL